MLGIISVLVFGLCFTVCFFGSIVTAQANQRGGSLFLGILAVIFCGFLTFLAGPQLLGYGHVTSKVETFGVRLKNGVVYGTEASVKVGEKNYVVLLKEFPSRAHFALRVEAQPPETFVLIDGQPVEVHNPVIKPSLP